MSSFLLSVMSHAYRHFKNPANDMQWNLLILDNTPAKSFLYVCTIGGAALGGVDCKKNLICLVIKNTGLFLGCRPNCRVPLIKT
jgi:hypothetical protein